MPRTGIIHQGEIWNIRCSIPRIKYGYATTSQVMEVEAAIQVTQQAVGCKSNP